MCRFCENTGNDGGELIIKGENKQVMLPLCVQCRSKLDLHGADVCQNCGNTYLRDDGPYTVKYIDYCDNCRYRKIPYVLKNGNGAVA